MHWLVFALIDPRDGATRYVGITKRLKKRVANHQLKGNPRKMAWLAALNECGLRPEGKVLEANVKHDERFIREGFWIKRLRDEGCDLLNDLAHPGIISADDDDDLNHNLCEAMNRYDE